MICVKEAQPPHTATITQNKCTNESSQSSIKIKQTSRSHCNVYSEVITSEVTELKEITGPTAEKHCALHGVLEDDRDQTQKTKDSNQPNITRNVS